MIFNKSIYNTHWNTKELNELGIFSRGKSKHRPRNDSKLFENGKYPLIQTGDIKNAILYINSHTQNYNEFGLEQSKLWDKGTLCITIAANIADTAILSYPMCFPDSVVGFSAYTKETSEIFMHYIFIYIQKAIQNSVIGSIQDNINIDYLKKLRFKIPPKEYQDKIVSILSSIDKKIELNNKINSELEAMAKTIYDYWFLQFEFPNEDGKPYKSSGGKMVWNEELKREIPEGWEIKSIFDELSVQYGFPFATDKFTDVKTDIPVVRIRDILTNTISTYSNENVDEKYRLNEQDLLIGMDGNFHMNYWIDNTSYLNQRSVRLRTKDTSNVSIIQVKYNIAPYIKAKEERAGGSTVGHLSDKDLKELKILVPKTKKLREILDNTLMKIVKNRKENQELTSLRDFLLPLLMNGQVGFKEE